jgi:hypothetical protein
MESLPSRARLPRSVIVLDVGDRHGVGIAHHRHDEALVGADRDADVIVILVDEILAVDLGIDRREFPSARRYRPSRRSP